MRRESFQRFTPKRMACSVMYHNVVLVQYNVVDVDLLFYVTKLFCMKGLKRLEIFNKVGQIYRSKDLNLCCDIPRNFDDENHLILNNKDGRFAWRPLEIRYYSLLNHPSHTTPSPSESRICSYAGCPRSTGAMPWARASAQLILPLPLSS